MRAFNVLKALSDRHRIHLVNADVFRSGSTGVVDKELRTMCESVVRVRLSFMRNFFARSLRFLRRYLPCLFRLVTRAPLEYTCANLVDRKALGCVLDHNFDRVFVFRLYVYPVAHLFKQINPDAIIYLDLDDIESITRSRIAELRRRSDDQCEAALLEREAVFFERLEQEVLPTCESVFVASETDRIKAQEKTGAPNLLLLPNVYSPRRLPPQQQSSADFTFLFIGSFAYYPNHEAAVVLCREIIPRLEKLASESILFRFAGAGASPGLQRLIQDTKQADYVGLVEDIDAAYAGISAVVAPIQAGGGTRIKILEAFAFGKPVVSTPLGAEGIECEDEVHLLLATGSEEFANQCQRLVKSPPLCESLAGAAEELLRRKYGPEQLNSGLAGLQRKPKPASKPLDISNPRQET